VERWILARLRHQCFFSLGALNQAIAALLIDLNNRAFKKLPGCRASAFADLDAPQLRPLPATRMALASFKRARVNIDYHVEFEGHPPITEAEAEVYLARDLQSALAATLRYCPVLSTEPDGRLAAIVDFTFNLGAGRLQTSTLRRRVNQRDWIAAGQELRRWVFGGGGQLPGLVRRRQAEIAFMQAC